MTDRDLRVPLARNPATQVDTVAAAILDAADRIRAVTYGRRWPLLIRLHPRTWEDLRAWAPSLVNDEKQTLVGQQVDPTHDIPPGWLSLSVIPPEPVVNELDANGPVLALDDHTGRATVEIDTGERDGYGLMAPRMTTLDTTRDRPGAPWRVAIPPLLADGDYRTAVEALTGRKVKP